MSFGDNQPKLGDQGLVVLTNLLHLHGIAADPAQIQHGFGGAPIGVQEMLRFAKQTGLKARVFKTSFARLEKTPLPGIAPLKDGGFILLGKAGDGKILVQSPLQPRPHLMSQAELEEIWDGRIVLVTRRSSLVDLKRRFDITWFLGAVVNGAALSFAAFLAGRAFVRQAEIEVPVP